MLVRRFSQAFRAVPRAPVTAQLPVSTAVSLRFCAAASTPERIVGTVDQWHDDKGFGFVKDSVGMTYFVHFRDLSVVSSGYRALAKGQSIQFTSAKVGGKWRAEEVTSEDGSPLPSGPPKPVSSTAAAGEEGSEDAAAGSENSAWDEGSAAADGAADGAGTPSGGRDKERKEYKPMVRSHGSRSRGATTTDTSNEARGHRHRKGPGDGAARHDSRRDTTTTHHAKFDTPVSTAVSAADVVEPSSPVSEYQRGFLEGYHAAMVAALQLRAQGLPAQGGHSAATSGTPPQQQQQQHEGQQQQEGEKKTSHRWHGHQGHHQHQKQHQGGGRGGDQHQHQQQQQRHNSRHDAGSNHHQHQQQRSHNGGRQNGYQQQQQRQDHRQQRHDQRGGGHSGGRSHHQGGNRQYGQQQHQQHEQQQQWRQQQNHGGSRSQRHQNQASDTSGSNDGGSGANWSGW